MACNFKSIHHIGTKYATYQRYFILALSANSLEAALKKQSGGI